MADSDDDENKLKNKFTSLNEKFLVAGLTCEDLRNVIHINNKRPKKSKSRILGLFIITIAILYECNVLNFVSNYAVGIRCLIPNNYFVWEATRPVTNCSYCSKITKPLIFQNLTRKQFREHAYSSKPMVIKGAFLHWPAREKFDYYFFKQLYNRIEGSYESVEEECQFLHFNSDFISLRDIFSMKNERVKNLPGEKSWYVGWCSSHPKILKEMRKYYEIPHFLPEDCEISSKEYVFIGYDAGATMHLDFINRLMWQAQLKGSKTWFLSPTPECEDVCKSFSFLVEPGDAVLVDTRIWYHGTTVKPGDFSLAIQSEYG